MPLLAAPLALLALLTAPEPAYLWPTEVTVCADSSDVGASEWARALLPEHIAVRVVEPAEWLAERSPGLLTLVRRSALADRYAELALTRALERGRTVVLAEGMAPGSALMGLQAVPLPRGWRELPDSRGGVPHLGAVPLDAAISPSTRSLADARADALRSVGRSEPVGAAGVALRWTAGPRSGARLLVVPCGSPRDLERCLAWADGPLLTRAESDYALVREGEDLRILAAGVTRHRREGGMRLRLIVTSPSGGPTWRGTLDLPDPEASDDAGALREFAAEQIVPARAWRAPSLGIRAELLSRAGAPLDRLESRAIVEPTELPANPFPAPSVTRRRLSLAQGSTPTFGVEAGTDLPSLPSAPGARSDMAGWEALLTQLRDAGCTVVATPTGGSGPPGEPEFHRRWVRARALAALRSGLTPELLLDRAVTAEELLGADPSGALVAAAVLLRSWDPTALLAAGWPEGRIAPAPTEVSPDGWLPLSEEMRCVASLEPVRVVTPALSPLRLWASLALGDGGALVDARDRAVDAAPLLEASLVSRLLGPGGQPQRIGVLVPEDGGEWAEAVTGQLDGAGYDWSPWRVEETHDWPGATRALVLRGAEGLGVGPLSHLAAWLEVGGAVVAPRADFAALAADVSGGDIWRVGQGSLGAWEAASAASLPARLSTLGLEPLLAPADGAARILRNVAGDGGELVCLFPSTGEVSTVRLPVAGHTVEVGCAPGQPAAASGTPTGPWLVSGLGSVTIDGVVLLSLAASERATLVALDSAPLLTSRCVLLIASGTGEAVLGGAVARAGDAGAYAVDCSGRSISLESRPSRRAAGALRLLPQSVSDGRPLLVASPGSAGSAQRRLGGLLWGKR